jgi:arylsulfatase
MAARRACRPRWDAALAVSLLITSAVVTTPGCAPRRSDGPNIDEDISRRVAAGAWLAAEPTIDLRRGAGGSVPPAGQSIVLASGWSHTEASGTWALGEMADFAVDLLEGDARSLVLESAPFQVEGRRQTLAVLANGRELGVVEMAPRWDEYRLAIPPLVLHRGRNQFELRFGYAVAPREIGQGDDVRKLAARFRRIAVERGDAVPDEARGDESTVGVDSESGLPLPGPGLLVAPVRLHGGANRVEIAARTADPSATVALGLVGLDGARTETSEASPDLEGGVKLTAEVSAADEGVRAFLLLRTELQPGSSLTLERASLLSHGAGLEPPKGRREAPADRPDIVVVIPDALRPDHLGFAGYQRDTSPNLDRLAAEALVFPNAVAAASYSLASVGTIVTGMSPLRHGVLAREHRLADAVTTLAETLRETGYRTVGVSANAYHSPQFGFDQGYDRFVPMWRVTDGDELRSFDPHLAVAEVKEELRQEVGEGRPLFLLLHLVPPHSPYDPPPAFDLFSIPGYRGPVGRDRETYLRLSSGALKPGPADLEQVVGLYDGNIRRVDDAVGELLTLLRSRSRWQQTVVLVIADHGEAFGEHGAFGHTTTVYEEMIRVPFIVRVPPGRAPADVDIDRLVSLEDVTPTLLGLAGVSPAGELDGIDLLAPAVGERAVDRVVLVCGGGATRPAYGVRTDRWKAVLRELHQRELYDLRSDPLESTDVAGDNPELLAGLASLLAEALAQSGGAADSAGALAPEEKEALRALGYLTD